MNETKLDILNAIPLTEVMRGWGYVAQRDGESSASYLCPWHDDHRPSLVVDKQVRKDATDLGFKCFACGEEGYGAIQLAARLMGLPAGKVAKEDLPQVMAELETRCDVELPQEEKEDGKKQHFDTLRTTVIGWNDFREQEKQYADMKEGDARFERGEWTEEGLKALGLKVELATRKAKKKDIGDGQGAAEIKVGDLLTEFDENDILQPLYRCSFGKDFYRGPLKAEKRTIKTWGAELERLFGVEPVSRFIHCFKPGNGGLAVRIVRATKNYPIFMFR